MSLWKYENRWPGSYQQMADTTDATNPVTEMGARVSLRRLAKFTSPDQVEGAAATRSKGAHP